MLIEIYFKKLYIILIYELCVVKMLVVDGNIGRGLQEECWQE